MKITALILLPFLCAASGRAEDAVNFSGRWKATGTFTERRTGAPPTTSPCSEVSVAITHAGNTLTVDNYKADCGTIKTDWGPIAMTIKNGKVYEGDEETGTLAGNLLKTTSKSGGVSYAFNLRLTPASKTSPAILATYYGVGSAMGAMVIEGNLQIVP